jgi:hypothetical protein
MAYAGPMEKKLGTPRPMTRMCRCRRRRQMSWQEIFPHVRIVSDPTKIAQLNAENEKRKKRSVALMNAHIREIGKTCRKM